MQGQRVRIIPVLACGILGLLAGKATGLDTHDPSSSSLVFDTGLSLERGDYGGDETVSVRSWECTIEYEASPRWSFFITVVPWLSISETTLETLLIRGRTVVVDPVISGPSRSRTAGRDSHHPEPPHDGSHTPERHPSTRHHPDHHFPDHRYQRATATHSPDQRSPAGADGVITATIADGSVSEYRRRLKRESGSGIGDTTMGVAYSAVEESATLPQLRLLAAMTVPTAEADKGLGSGTMGYRFGIGLSKEVGDLTAFGEVSYDLAGSGEEYEVENVISASLGLAGDIIPGMETYIQLSGGEPDSEISGTRLAVELGLQYDFRKFGTVSAFFSKGLANGSPDYGIGFGWSLSL